MNAATSLNAGQRRRLLDRLSSGAERYDVVVVGGGISGAGVALDAAARGLRVLLAERHDLAHGTSRWSSKLVHGGLRYLRHGQVDVAWESARERHLLMTVTAPHLVRSLPFLAVLDGGLPPFGGVLTELGIRGGDLLRVASRTSRSVLPGPRRISANEALRLVPGLRRDGMRGAILFWDGQLEDDARLVVAVARTAAGLGADVLTHCGVEWVDEGRVGLRDSLAGESCTVTATTVVNAAGVWASEVDPSVRLRPSKGSHLVLDAAAIGDPRAAVIVPVPGESARWVGATPTGDGRVILGLTDDEHHGPIEDEPRVTDAEAAFLLDTLATAFGVAVTPAAVIGGFAGYRPLLDTGGGATADISRKHAILSSQGGRLLTLVGGKLTTYRRMAQDAVDRAVGEGGPRCRTASLPLVGALPRAQLGRVDAPSRLVRRFGGEAPAVAALAGQDGSLLEPVVAGGPVLGVELLFGLLHEGALDVDDLLDRRVRLGLVPHERAAAETLARQLVSGVAA
ncbi:MAG: glycerol-3-phosphate dehydrogenase/oxidase [Candidatus Dormibacteria bacterium]